MRAPAGTRPTVRIAAASHAASSARRQRQPDEAEVGERLHDVAVGVLDVEVSVRKRGRAVA